MAVQAQYPSNVLLQYRNGQDRKNTLGNDYSLLQQQSGGVLDQSNMFFNNNGVGSNNNHLKRRREDVNINAPINLFTQQQQQSQTSPIFVNLAQLQNHQNPNIVSTGLQLAFSDHQQQLQHQQQQQHLHHQQQQQHGLVLNLPSSSLSSLLSDDLSAQMKQQRDEIDQFLQAQGNQLKRTLADRRQRHYHALLSTVEESASRMMREKEIEIEKAVRKNIELEEKMAQVRMEAQIWQAKAKSQEETAASLQVQLQHAIMSGGAQDKREEGGLNCAAGEAEDAESAYIDPERVVPVSVSSSHNNKVGPSCKACRRRVASVVVLPCQHLCLCTECDTAVEACPLCLSYRSASVEVFLS